MRIRSILLPLSLAIAFFAATARSTLIFDETAAGDLSSNRLNPTLLTVSAGSNALRAWVAKSDQDYFTLLLPEGASLVSVFIRNSTGSEATILSLQSGSTFTEAPSSADYSNVLGYASFSASDIGADIFPRLGSASDAIGFQAPLTDNSYTFWVQQNNPNPAEYQLEFVVAAAVPAPGSIVAAAIGLLYAFPRPRRREFNR